MRVVVVYGADAKDLTNKVNSWLEANEGDKVILTIGPCMPRDREGGGYITITYTDREQVFEKIQ